MAALTAFQVYGGVVVVMVPVGEMSVAAAGGDRVCELPDVARRVQAMKSKNANTYTSQTLLPLDIIMTNIREFMQNEEPQD